MIKVAITGNIASGKSQVENELISLGYKVADTDKINHFILASDLDVIKEIKEAFKDDDIFDENEKISREKLGKIVFSVGWKKIKLEQILHARINERLKIFYQENIKENIVFVSIPLLFETKQEDSYDKIIFISADEDIRLKRLIKRNGYDEKYARIRIASQSKEKDKIEKSDYVIYNNSDLSNLKKQIKDVLHQLILSC